MKRAVAILGLACAATCLAGVEEVKPLRGRPAAPISWTDESGRVRSLSGLAGYPVVVLPMYTRCPSACLLTVAQLKKALGDSHAEPAQFRVLLFSIDPTDTPKSLAAYRQREGLPLNWFLGATNQADAETFLESIGFSSAKAGTEFMHPNLLVFLDAKLRVAKWIYGTDYSAGDFDAALKVAGGQSDWIGRHFDVLYVVLVCAAALLCVALVQELTRRKAGAAPAGHRPSLRV